MQLYFPVDLTGNLVMIEKLVLGEIWTGDLPIFNPDALTCAPSRRFHGKAITKSRAIELTSFLWHLPGDVTEFVTEHSSKLQPSINLHAPVTATRSGTQCTTPKG